MNEENGEKEEVESNGLSITRLIKKNCAIWIIGSVEIERNAQDVSGKMFLILYNNGKIKMSKMSFKKSVGDL